MKKTSDGKERKQCNVIGNEKKKVVTLYICFLCAVAEAIFVVIGM